MNHPAMTPPLFTPDLAGVGGRIRAQNEDFDERLARVERLYLEELMKTHDANEGLAAFIEKRKPAWTGR